MHSIKRYRKAKTFKLDEDNEVNDEFSGSSKRPIKPDWDSRRGGGLWHKVSNPQGYLQSRLGNLWDDVWSEVCRVAKHNKPHVERFIRERIQNNVEIDARAVDGVLFGNGRFRRYELSPAEFYVLDGVLCRMPAKSRDVRQAGSYRYWESKPRHYDKKTLTVGDIIYWQDKQTYNRRIAPGVHEEVVTLVWYKDIPYQYSYTVKDWGKDFLSVLTVRTETRYKVVAVSKKAIKKYKLNEIS